MKLQNKPFNNVIASGTDNVVVPTESQNREGIQYKSETKSNVPNGFFYSLSEAIQYLQFTVGLYDASAEYTEGNICKLLYKDASGYQLKSFRRNNKHSSITKGNAPYKPATITTTNGIDCYSEGTANEDWDEIKSGLSAYIFQIPDKNIDNLLNGNYTKDNISSFLSAEKFNELYNACQNFMQVYFLDCLVSYKSAGTYTSGAQQTNDLKNFKYIALNIMKGGAINIRFDYNETDVVYSDYYSRGIKATGKKILELQDISSDLIVGSGQDAKKIIPNMEAIAKIKSSSAGIIQKTTLKNIIFGQRTMSDDGSVKDLPIYDLPVVDGNTKFKQEVDLLEAIANQEHIDKSKINIVSWNFKPYKFDYFWLTQDTEGAIGVAPSTYDMSNILNTKNYMFNIETNTFSFNCFFQLCDENIEDVAADAYADADADASAYAYADADASAYADAYASADASAYADYGYGIAKIGARYHIDTKTFTGDKLKFVIYSTSTGLHAKGYINLSIEMRYQVIGD